MKQIALPISLGRQTGFDNFLTGDNAAAVAALCDFLAQEQPGVIYLWGASGTGKTHLLRAAWWDCLQRGQQAGHMGLFEAGLGTDALHTPGWSTHALDPQASFDPLWSLIVLDDVDQFNADQQQQAFAWMIHAQACGCKVVAAGSGPPANLQLRDDLRTRLAWGQVFALNPLSETDCKVVLAREALARGIVLSPEVMDFVMNRFSRDLSSLMLLLDTLDTYSLEAKRAITIPLITAMFKTL